MSLIRKNFINGLAGLALGFTVLALFYIGGCGTDTTTNPPVYVDNPNVKHFDSVNIEEDSALSKFSTMNLLVGTNGLWNNGDRDCSLYGPVLPGDTTYSNFYLRTGTLANLVIGGYETMYFRVDQDMAASTFDTLSKVPGYDSLRSIDFTQLSTEFWGYFKAPLTSLPVYCFWLKGKKDAGVTSKNVFGILQPREATDNQPGTAWGFRMSFRIRINTNGDNDFRKQILQP